MREAISNNIPTCIRHFCVQFLDPRETSEGMIGRAVISMSIF